VSSDRGRKTASRQDSQVGAVGEDFGCTPEQRVRARQGSVERRLVAPARRGVSSETGAVIGYYNRRALVRKSVKSLVVVATAVAVTALATGVAYAFVAVTGSGSSNQPVVSSNAYSIQVTVSQVTDLTPGTAQPITVTVTNKGPSKVKVSQALLSLPATVSGVDAAALGTVHLTQPAVAAAVLDKSGASSTTTFTGSIVIDDSADVDQTTLLGKSLTVTANVS
jgi:hypothetical protein